jgi:peptidoglycan biosynthesis protein MviN/MurJ (putative lipid II flippase)
MTDELLKPSLENSEPAPILSSGALMGAAFFGGPIAVTIVAVLNSDSLGRLKQEWPMIIGVLGVGAVAVYLFGNYVFDGLADARSFRYAARAAGFVSFGWVWLMHRKELRALSTLGITPRSPWGPVIAACLVAMALHAWIVMVLTGAVTNGV